MSPPQWSPGKSIPQAKRCRLPTNCCRVVISSQRNCQSSRRRRVLQHICCALSLGLAFNTLTIFRKTCCERRFTTWRPPIWERNTVRWEQCSRQVSRALRVQTPNGKRLGVTKLCAARQGLEGFLSSKDALKRRTRQYRLEDRLFSLSSKTSPAVRPSHVLLHMISRPLSSKASSKAAIV